MYMSSFEIVFGLIVPRNVETVVARAVARVVYGESPMGDISTMRIVRFQR